LHTAVVKLKSVSPYSQGKVIRTPREERETAADHEERTWRERMHVTEHGFVQIPQMAFKNCISEAAKFLGIQIPGKGKSTYTKHFESGVLVLEPLILKTKAVDVQGEWLFVPSDGKRGGGSRVWKCFPVIPQWAGEVTFNILDDAITKKVFTQHLEEAGKFIGLGRFRPRNNGFYGRFSVEDVAWE